MTTSDPDSELEQLAQCYAGMTPEELRKVAEDAHLLTGAAKDALRAEITRRGLGITPNTAPSGTDVIEERDLVMVRRFRDLHEALLAKGGLESAGIECFLTDDNMVRMDWFMSNLFGGVKLSTNREDADAAAAVLDQPVPETFEVDGVGEYQQPHCPQCQSLDINFEELNKKVAYPSAWLGMPVPLHRSGWTCHSCGHRWPDDSPESED